MLGIEGYIRDLVVLVSQRQFVRYIIEVLLLFLPCGTQSVLSVNRMEGLPSVFITHMLRLELLLKDYLALV